MYLSVPVLNAVVQSLDRRRQYKRCWWRCCCESGGHAVLHWATDVTFVNNRYSFIWFYTLYFINSPISANTG